LYPNPVCFLCTPGIVIQEDDDSNIYCNTVTQQHHPKPDDGMNETNNKNNICIVQDKDDQMTVTAPVDESLLFRYHDNVMIISWLTAINNEGKFIMSMNRHRYTSNYFLQYQKRRHRVPNSELLFVLAVPVRGMEQLIRNVGSVSGRAGIKFSTATTASSSEPAAYVPNTMSKRQKRKLGFPNGIPGLYKTPVGSKSNTTYTSFIPSTYPTSTNESHSLIESTQHFDTTTNVSSLFAVDGTVAHMVSSVMNVVDSNNDTNNNNKNIVDDNHLLITAQVIDAYVRTNYWDDKKNIFRPLSSTVPTYLTFFGAQEFGYVVP
jgi:hypothetical protein